MAGKKAKRTTRPADAAPIRAFKDAKAWESWLAKNQIATDGIWMRIAKKSSGKKSITYAEAVEVALCHGWIDAKKRPESETTWLQWESAYDSPTNATMDAAFEKELNRLPKAKAFFERLSRTNRYAILWRIQTAKKPETRERRMRTYIEMLEKGETIH
jgi:uncharacterized protein YdeI (YjbR/CyaY-like superfamily)